MSVVRDLSTAWPTAPHRNTNVTKPLYYDLSFFYLDRVVDGDSFRCVGRRWAWFNRRESIDLNVRLMGCDTHELRGGTAETKALARDAKIFTKVWLLEHDVIEISVIGEDSFGRQLCEVYSPTTKRSLTHDLIAAGLTTGRYE